MPAAWEDARILEGMAAQLALRCKLLSSGEKPLGWKLAFGGAAAMERLRIQAPLVGFLTGRAVLPTGSQVAISSWTKAAAEPELAVYLGKDIPPDADRETVRAAIAAIAPAIELADVDDAAGEVSGILARNIYQRHVVVGRSDAGRSGGRLAGLRCRVLRNSMEVANTTDLEALTGDLTSVVQHTAKLLGCLGHSLDEGQLLIAGSITPPFWVAPGEEFTFELEPVDTISVSFA